MTAVAVHGPDAPASEEPIVILHGVAWLLQTQSDIRIEAMPEFPLVSGRIGYLGPKPPFGTHTYRFHVYVLDTTLELQPGAGRRALQRAMEGHVLQVGLLRGRFGSE